MDRCRRELGRGSDTAGADDRQAQIGDFVQKLLGRLGAGMAPGSPIHCDQAVHARVEGFLGPLSLCDVVVDDATHRGDTIHDPAWFSQ